MLRDAIYRLSYHLSIKGWRFTDYFIRFIGLFEIELTD